MSFLTNPIASAISGKDRTPTEGRAEKQKRVLEEKISQVYDGWHRNTRSKDQTNLESGCFSAVVCSGVDLLHTEISQLVQMAMHLMQIKVPDNGRDSQKLAECLGNLFRAFIEEIEKLPADTLLQNRAKLANEKLTEKIIAKVRQLRPERQNNQQIMRGLFYVIAEEGYAEILSPLFIIQLMKKLFNNIDSNLERTFFRISSRFIILLRKEKQGSGTEKAMKVLQIMATSPSQERSSNHAESLGSTALTGIGVGISAPNTFEALATILFNS